MEIISVTDSRFQQYGRVIYNLDFSELLDRLRRTKIPEGTVYVPSEPLLEAVSNRSELEDVLFGELKMQIGYCNGHNTKLNCLEYHRSSEINVVCTDTVLLLGKQSDISTDFSYDTSLVKAFLIPAGTAVEIYADTLHYAPCHTLNEGFRCAVLLPEGTNTELQKEHDREGEDRLLWAKNKWLIAHPESPEAAQEAFVGLVGDNIILEL